MSSAAATLGHSAGRNERRERLPEFGNTPVPAGGALKIDASIGLLHCGALNVQAHHRPHVACRDREPVFRAVSFSFEITGANDRAVKALTLRIALSVAIFALLLLGYRFGGDPRLRRLTTGAAGA